MENDLTPCNPLKVFQSEEWDKFKRSRSSLFGARVHYKPVHKTIKGQNFAIIDPFTLLKF